MHVLSPTPDRERTIRWTLFAALIVWVLAVGKDVSWDVVNHHFYLPFSWLSGRYRTDLFGAGPQSYQNPLGYFPVYALAHTGGPAWLIGVMLASAHAVVIWPLSRIANALWPGDSELEFWWRVLALALSCVAPVFLIHVGATSMDPLTSLMVVGAAALSLGEPPRPGPPVPPRIADALFAGALVGLAASCKLSNAIFGVALFGLWVLRMTTERGAWRALLAFTLASVAAFALSAGYWMSWLWRDFGNPVFPLFNNLFHSPYAPDQPILAQRFVPAGFTGAVARLGELAQLSSFVSYEAFIPDLRPAVAGAALALLLPALLLRRGGLHAATQSSTWRTPSVHLVVLCVLSYALWVRSSGNARYGLPLFMLAGLLTVRAVQRLLPASMAKIVLLLLLLLQCAYYGMDGDKRFTGTSWDNGPYLEYRVPERLKTEPFLHLAIGVQTNAAVALFLDPRGALANPIGQFGLPVTGPLGDRLAALRGQWKGRTRLLFGAPPDIRAPRRAPERRKVSALLYRLRLDVNWSDCETIEMVLSDDDLRTAPGAPSDAERHSSRTLLSCGIVEGLPTDPAIEAERVVAEQVFTRIEHACPTIFGPTPFVSEHGPGVWERHYMDTDARVYVSSDGSVYMTHFRSMQGTGFGTVAEVLDARRPLRCPSLSFLTPP